MRTGREDWFGLGRVEAVRSALGVPPGSDESQFAGIPSVAPEPVADRVARALRVVAMGAPTGWGADDSTDGAVEVSADTEYGVGVVASRLQVALRGEGIDTRLPAAARRGTDGDWRVRLDLLVGGPAGT